MRGDVGESHRTTIRLFCLALGRYAASRRVAGLPQDASVPNLVSGIDAYLQYRAPETCSLAGAVRQYLRTMVAFRSEAIVTGRKKTAWSRPHQQQARREDRVRRHLVGEVIRGADRMKPKAIPERMTSP